MKAEKKQDKQKKEGIKQNTKVEKKVNTSKMNQKSTSHSSDKRQKMAKFIVVGILLFGMIFTSFSYLVYALQSL